MEKISIIVPVYNVELYLEECIESILNQTYKNFELIIIDDGSRDSSSQICDRYAERDSRILVVHKENGGLSSARNIGLDLATGSYITFIDSDDKIDKEFLRKAIIQLEKSRAEIIIYDYLKFVGDEVIQRPQIKEKDIEYISGWEACKCLYGNENIRFTIACAKIYSQKLVENVRFPVGKIHEDEYTTYKILYNAKKIVLINEALYYYRKNPNSITEVKFSVKRYDGVLAYEERMQFFQEKDEKELLELTKEKRDVLVAKNFLLAKKNKMVKKIPKEYKVTIIKAIRILKKNMSEDLFEYVLYQYSPLMTKLYCVIRKAICRFM